MKKKKVKSMILLIAGIALAILGLAFLSIEDGIYATGLFVIIGGAAIIISVVEMLQYSKKNTHVIEAEFISIGKYADGWVGCYFNVNGKETRIAIMNDVFNPKLLMPGGKYKLTLKNKGDSVIQVERIG